MILFEPTDQAMVLEYPELQGIDEFKILSDSELRFVWHYACKHSPYYHIDNETQKIDMCVQASYKQLPAITELKQFYAGQFPDSIRMAMARMAKFVTSDRNRARGIVEKIFDTFEKIIDTASEDEELLKTPAKQSAYIDNASKISGELPVLIKMKEEGFGYKQRKGKADGKQPTLMDMAMKEEN